MDAGAIVVACQAPECVWRDGWPATPAGLREAIGAIREHCTSKHRGSCRSVRVVIHQAGEACDHERPA